jgi:hypothetical protein
MKQNEIKGWWLWQYVCVNKAHHVHQWRTYGIFPFITTTTTGVAGTSLRLEMTEAEADSSLPCCARAQNWTDRPRTLQQCRLPSLIHFVKNCQGRSQWPSGLRRGSAADRLQWLFESRRGHGCLSVVSVMCCQVEVSATSRSLVQRSPTDCGVSLCVIKCNNPSTLKHG